MIWRISRIGSWNSTESGIHHNASMAVPFATVSVALETESYFAPEPPARPDLFVLSHQVLR